MSAAPLVDAATLRAAGRNPAMPCRVALADGRELELLRSLRVLPGKRIVAEAVLDGEHVLAKVFISDAAERHAQREREGIEALVAAGIDTPALVWNDALTGGGQALLTRFLPAATSLAEHWKTAAHPPGDAASLALLAPILTQIGRMHAAGVTQSDLHYGNFLMDAGRTWVIDGDTVDRHTAPLAPEPAAANLAILLAQLPPAWDDCLGDLLHHYVAGGGHLPDPAQLSRQVEEVRQRRLDDLLEKGLRDCTLFAVNKSFKRFSSVVRDEAGALAPLLADLDGAMARGALLKDGRTVTVAKVQLGERAVVIKRYKIKGTAHGLSRMLRPSRAWHSWLASIRLRFFGIDTPRALAMIEERIGPLRRKAWLVTEWDPGVRLNHALRADQLPDDDLAVALRATFTNLVCERIQHGDLKATNLLWHAERLSLSLIDLDATTAHRTPEAFARAWARDRARLLRNWPQNSALVRWLDANLPPTAP